MATKQKKETAFMKPVQPSAELGAIVGTKPIPRTEIVKKLWDYIKEHKLQNPKNKREICPDAKLAKVLGNKPVDMFKMTSLVSKHINDVDAVTAR